MAESAFPVPDGVFTEDLFKPIFSAAWVALFMAVFDGVGKNKKVLIFTAIVLVGVVAQTRKRIERGEED